MKKYYLSVILGSTVFTALGCKTAPVNQSSQSTSTTGYYAHGNSYVPQQPTPQGYTPAIPGGGIPMRYGN